jgi:hypothetical protein
MQKLDLKCTDESPKKDVKIRYGDSHLSVDIKEKRVNRDDYLVFDLKPDPGKGPPPRNVDFEKAVVTVIGKNDASKWIYDSGSYEAKGGKLMVCVPSDQADGTYLYDIKVAGVGQLDPRAIVE